MSQQRKSSVTSLPPLSSSNLLSASLKQYLKRRGSLGQDSKKAEWATLTDRTLSPDERKRLAKAAAQELFASKSQHNHRCSRPSISSSKTLKSQNHRLTRSSSSTSKELSKDFLTLVCYNAVATGQLGLLKTLHTSGKIPLVDKQGNTPLHIAAKFGQLRCLRWLLQCCCIPLLAKNLRGETCVHVAALHGNLKCLQTILSEPDSTAGAFAAAVERDNAGLTCLHYATMGNRDATVFWLVAKFGKELCLIRSMDGVLAIHFATASGNKECTEVLVKACKKSVNLKDVFGATPVYYAAQEGQLEVLQFLVEQAEGSLDLVACEGMTPLLTAVEGGHLGVVKYILEKQGRGALFATTHDGATVYHYAAGNGKTEILRFLLEAPERRELLFITDMNEKTPAHDAAEQGHVDCLQLLLEHRLSLYLPDRVVCDPELVFINVVAKWPGSVHDARILRETLLFQAFEDNNKPLNGFILGDSGYMLRDWLKTPILNPQNAKERNYNFTHSSTRTTVERSIGVAKKRWHCLHSGLRLNPAKVCRIITVCLMLHNRATLFKLPLPEESDDDDDDGLGDRFIENNLQSERARTAAGKVVRDLWTIISRQRLVDTYL